MSPYMKLALKWEAIADKLDNKPVEMTANTHRLFANELKTVCAQNAEAAFSWNGHIIYGDKESVRAVLLMVAAPSAEFIADICGPCGQVFDAPHDCPSVGDK